MCGYKVGLVNWFGEKKKLYWLFLRPEDFSTKTITNEKSKIKVK